MSDGELEAAARRRRWYQLASASAGAVVAALAGSAAAIGAVALAPAAAVGVPAVALLGYAGSQLASTDYDSPSEVAALRQRLVRSPAAVLPKHRPRDLYRRDPGAAAAELRLAADGVGGLALLAACRRARGGGLFAVVHVQSPEVASALADAAAAALARGAEHRASLPAIVAAASPRCDGWRAVEEAGGEPLCALLEDAAVEAARRATLKELAAAAGSAPVDRGNPYAAARDAARALFTAGSGLVACTSAAGGPGPTTRLVRARLVDAGDVVAALCVDARSSGDRGRGLVAVHEAVGAGLLTQAAAAGGREALRALLLIDMRRAARGTDAYEELLRSDALDFADASGGFSEPALVAALVEHQRRWRQARKTRRESDRRAREALGDGADRTASRRQEREAERSARAPSSAQRDVEDEERKQLMKEAYARSERELSLAVRDLQQEWVRIWRAAAPVFRLDEVYPPASAASAERTAPRTSQSAAAAAGAAAAARFAAAQAQQPTPVRTPVPATADDELASKCKVCMAAPLEVLLRPCKHVVLCQECAGDPRMTRCPMCRETIVDKERVHVL